MPNENASQLERELHEVKGALDVLFSLREEIGQWVEEAQDDSKREELENVLAHIEAVEGEYKPRQADLMKRRGRA
jgi:hypothetical protein